jgi:hypothetical protein
MKPLVRWTIGPASATGFEILTYSVREFKRIYTDEFDYIICYNNLNAEQLEIVESLGVDLYEQTKQDWKDQGIRYPFKGGGPCWVLFPSRLRPESHELFIDNDLILFKRLPHLDAFLGSTTALIATSAIERAYGPYDSFIPKNMKINTGFYGVPPDFDFGNEIKKTIAKLPNPFEGQWAMQGIMSHIFIQFQHIKIPLRDLRAMGQFHRERRYGIHFIGANRVPTEAWQGHRDFFRKRQIRFD